MRPKFFIGFTAVTAVMVVLTILAVVLEDNPQTVLEQRKPAFPQLVERINEVASIEIGSRTGGFTVLGGGDGSDGGGGACWQPSVAHRIRLKR